MTIQKIVTTILFFLASISVIWFGSVFASTAEPTLEEILWGLIDDWGDLWTPTAGGENTWGETSGEFEVQGKEDAVAKAKWEEPKKSDTKSALDDMEGDEWDHDAAVNIDDIENRQFSGNKKSSASISEVKTDSITIKTTKVLYDETAVKNYKVYYAKESLARAWLNDIEEVVLAWVNDPKDDDMVMITLTGLDKNQKYYFVVSPVNPDDADNEPADMLTDEFNGSTLEKEKAKDPAPAENNDDNANAWNNNPPAAAAWPGKNDIIFKWVSYNNKDNKVTLSRNKTVKWVDKVEVSLRRNGETAYSTLGTQWFAWWTYTFNVDKAWNYFLKLKGMTNDGKEVGRIHTQTIRVNEVKDPTNTTQPAVTNPPKVWPTTDLLVGLLIFGMILYLMMRFRKVR